MPSQMPSYGKLRRTRNMFLMSVAVLAGLAWILRRWLQVVGKWSYRGRLALQWTSGIRKGQPSETPKASDGAKGDALPHDLHKTRPCRWFLMDGKCYHGERCVFAHTREEWRPLPQSRRAPSAKHWRGPMVSIGVVEQALFSPPALPPVTDVVCNRCTCLGNPFAVRIYGAGETPPSRDSDGWRAEEHEDLCAAFDEYLALLLDGDDGIDLATEVQRIASERRLLLADTWLAQGLRWRDVRMALRDLEERVAQGERIRLLCHCRPHVRCHTELLKAHLELHFTLRGLPVPSAVEEVVQDFRDGWPGLAAGDDVRCSKGQCLRRGRAHDPLDMKPYCVFCWMRHADSLKWKALPHQR